VAADNQVQLVRDGAHTTVMAAARAHAGDVEVMRDACDTLVNLAATADCRDRLARAGVREFAEFVSALHPDDTEVQHYCRRLDL